MGARWAAAVALAIAVSLAAVAGLPRAAVAGDEEKAPRGQSEYQKYCAACHGLAGRGDGPVAPSLDPPPADLTALGAKYGMPLPRPEIARLVDGTRLTHAHGSRDMPVWGKQLHPAVGGPERTTLVRGTILVIIEYLDAIQAPGAAS